MVSARDEPWTRAMDVPTARGQLGAAHPSIRRYERFSGQAPRRSRPASRSGSSALANSRGVPLCHPRFTLYLLPSDADACEIDWRSDALLGCRSANSTRRLSASYSIRYSFNIFPRSAPGGKGAH